MICVGESHMACVVAAAHEAGMPLEAIGLKNSVGRELQRTAGTRASKRAEITLVHPAGLRKLSGRLTGPVLSFVGGKDYLLLGLQRHPTPFDFVHPGEPGLVVEGEAQLVPYAAIYEVVKARAASHLLLFDQILRLAKGPVYQFESPPPAGQAWMEKNKRIAFIDKIAGPLLRYKLWRIHCDIIREHTEQHGARYVPSPPTAVDEQGLLRPEFCGNATHANVAYGSLVLEQITSLAEAEAAAPA